jgi:hypothetical protein
LPQAILTPIFFGCSKHSSSKNAPKKPMHF